MLPRDMFCILVTRRFSHTDYSSCDTKENMFKEDVFTFHLNNLRISGSVSLSGETNRSLGKKYHYQK